MRFPSLHLILLATLLLLAPFGCRQGPSVNLRQQATVQWIYDGRNQTAIPPVEGWQTLTPDSFDDKPINPDARAWFAYALPDDPGMNYLIITKCSNVTRIFQDGTLIREREPSTTYPLSVNILKGEPFLVLPTAERPSRLILETFYGAKTGYRPSCHFISISDQEMALYHVLTNDFAEMAAGSIILFMGIASLLLFSVRRQRMLIYFSLAMISMSATYMSASDIAYTLFTHTALWRLGFHLLLTFSPIAFFLFIDNIMPSRSRVARKLAWLNGAVFIMVGVAWLWNHDINLDSMRRSYYKLLFLELLIFLPFTLKAMFEKVAFSRRLGMSLAALTLGAVHDVGSLLFRDDVQLMILPWVLIVFISILLSIMMQKTIENAAALQRAKSKLIAERNDQLQSEVDRRTSDLNRRNSELERIHIELEDHHEILANQKEKVATIARDKDVILSRIADLRNQTIPRIFDCLQQLHLAFDDDSFSELNSHIGLLARTLEPAARQYEKSHVISKKRLLILDADRKHQRIYRMAIGGSKVDMQLAENPADFGRLIREQTFDLIALHHSWLGAASDIVRSTTQSRIVVLSSEGTLKNLAMMRQYPSLAHIVPLNLPRSVLQQILLIHLSKLLTHDIFGIEKYLAWGFEVKERPLPTIDQRDFLVRQVREDLEKMGLEADGIDAMAEITSCLLSLKKAHALVSDWSPHVISAPLQQLRYGFDASLVALSMDLRGQLLSQQDLIVFLERHIQEGETARSMPSLTRLMQLADALIINSDGDKRHELVILIFLEKNPQGHQPAAYFHFETH